MSPQPPAQPPARPPTGSAILSTTQAVKQDTGRILDLLTDQGEGEGEDRIDKILAALATLLELVTTQGQELAELRVAVAGPKPLR